MKNIIFFSLGVLSCLIVSSTFNKQNGTEKIVALNNLSNVLFANCGNQLMTNTAPDVDVNFSCTNGVIIKGPQRNMITLVPTVAGTDVVLEMDYQGQKTTQKFHTITCPQPEVTPMINGKPLDEKVGMVTPGPRQITIVPSAIPFFKNTLPMDSRYSITEWNAIVVRGKRPVAQQRFINGNGNITSFAEVIQAGDRILVEVTGIERINFQGKKESVPSNNLLYNLPIN